MQLVWSARIGPRLGADPRYCLGIELADVGGGSGVQPAAAHHGLGAPLLQGCVVQIGIGARDQGLERQGRRFGQIARDDADVAAFESAQHALEALDIHRIFETIADRLPHQRMIGNLDLTRQILGAGT